MREAGISPHNIRDLKDLNHLPVLTRDDIRDFSDQMRWPDYNKKIIKASSSGTTGIPITYYQDINSYSGGVAAGHVLTGFSGLVQGERTVYIWGNRESIKRWSTLPSRLKQIAYSKKKIPSTIFNDPENLPEIFKKIIRYKPLFMEGYANSIFELAYYMKNNNLKIPSIKGVITTAENLEEFQRTLIESIVAPVTDLYGCGEINGIACKPPDDNKYYIFDPHVLVETKSSENSEMEDILVTDLDNFYMPFIRYQVGDIIDSVVTGSETNKYPFSYFTKIFGRTSDHISLPDGKKLFPVNVFGGTAFRKFKSIKRHKTVWNGKRILFIFEVEGDLDINLLNKDILASLSDYNVPYEIKTTDRLLPSESGKHCYFEII
jgi:phenylacetate-CoA ligase